MDFKLIFIDVDNTLLDFDAYVKETLRVGFEKFGLRTYEPWMFNVFKEENDKLWCSLERGEITFEELHTVRFKIIFNRLNIDFDAKTFEKHFREALNESAIPVTGAMGLLDYLSKKYILATASNGPYNQQIHRLKLRQMDKYFTYNFVSEKCGASKPDREFFDYAFNEINENREEKISPSDCLIIGDSLTSDMKGGKAYGMKTLFYRRHPKTEPNENVDYLADSLDDIKTIL